MTDERAWDRGFEEHRLEQQRRLARLTLREKIAWLEEVQRVVEHLAKQRPDGPPPADRP